MIKAVLTVLVTVLAIVILMALAKVIAAETVPER